MRKLTECEINTLFRKNESFIKNRFDGLILEYGQNIFRQRPIEIQDATQECMIALFFLLRDKYDAERCGFTPYFVTHSRMIVKKVMKDIFNTSNYTGKISTSRPDQKTIDDNIIRNTKCPWLVTKHSGNERLIDQLADEIDCEKQYNNKFYIEDVVEIIKTRLTKFSLRILPYFLEGYSAHQAVKHIDLKRATVEYHYNLIVEEIEKAIEELEKVG